MNETLIALTGSPNSGKTALFNALTGKHQKVANYPGVTVEKKEGWIKLSSGEKIRVLDLPGIYSLNPKSPDEKITQEILLYRRTDCGDPDVLVAVADATNLERSLGLVLELKDLGKNLILVLNMMDLAEKRGLSLNLETLSKELGIPVVATVAIRNQGIKELLSLLKSTPLQKNSNPVAWKPTTGSEIRKRFNEVDRILKLATVHTLKPSYWTQKIDTLVLMPGVGHALLFLLMALVFQAVFSWAEPFMNGIEAGIGFLGQGVQSLLPDIWLRSLIVEGIITGVGSVVVFLPQIILLFFFVLMMEDSGYMARAAFLMDKSMSRVGLHGRAFLPLLSSFACAIPGIMATRAIPEKRDRLLTILIAPLMTCSARIPVYVLLIAAFIPNVTLWGPFKLQGVVLFALYLLSIPIALIVAWILKKTALPGQKADLLLELPTYKWPSLKNLFFGLKERASVFLKRAGTIILVCAMALWFLSSYPKPPIDSPLPAIETSYAGRMGKAIEPLFRPLGFDWRITTGLIPGFAAREVMVSSLATVFAVEEPEVLEDSKLTTLLSQTWSLATAFSLIIWFVFSPQCLSTLAIAKRETNSWGWATFMFVYLLLLAYGGAFVTYQLLANWL